MNLPSGPEYPIRGTDGRRRKVLLDSNLQTIMRHFIAAVAQLVEQRIRNAKVASSTPASGTRKAKYLGHPPGWPKYFWCAPNTNMDATSGSVGMASHSVPPTFHTGVNSQFGLIPALVHNHALNTSCVQD